MSPRRAGGALIAVSAVVGTGATFFLTTTGWWGLLAAAVLSAALACAGLGSVWTTRSTWEPEPAPSARSLERDVAAEARRSRRQATVFGVGLTAVSVTAAVAIAALAAQGGLVPEVVSVALVSAAGTVVGVSLIRHGRSRPASFDDEGEPADDDDDAPPPASTAGEWSRVTRRDPVMIAMYSAPVLLVSGFLLFQLVRLTGALAGGRLVGFVVALVVAGAVIGGSIFWVSRRYPEVWVHGTEQRVRVADREAAWSDLTAARLTLVSIWPGAPRTLFLTLETADGLRAPLPLRRRDRLVMTATERALVERMVAGSSIEMPRAPEDPHGRFSRFNFPEHVGRDDARALVLSPPGAGDPLPIPGG